MLRRCSSKTRRTAHAFDTEKGAYQFTAIKLKPGIPLQRAKEQLECLFANANVPVKVLTWKQSTGSAAQFASLTQGVLQVFVLFIFFVAAIVITNTLSMAALERTAEIGMMRAIGSQKGFIGKMLLMEIMVLAILFGGLGMLLGVGVVWELTALQLPTDSDDMLSLMAGGDVLHPVVDMMGFVYGSGQLAVVTILAALYPMIVARKITPLEAIARD
jgi:ABC-type lipoprotein release transport system permease subunit